MFVIWHRKFNLSWADSSGVRIVIPYWLGWGPFAFLVFWNVMNIQMGYWQWQNIANGTVGPRSWDKLHLIEIFAVLGFSILLWLVAGREVVTLDVAHLQIRKEVLGVGWSQRYQLTNVSAVRASCFLDPKANGKWNADHVRAALYFNYMGTMRSFGSELRMEDALLVEKTIQSFWSGANS